MAYQNDSDIQRRHFLVKEMNGEYVLKELDPAIARGIRRFGTLTGRFHSVKSIRWIFYFMHCNISPADADHVAAQLTQEFLEGQR
jgi:hypothetical protein